MKARQISIFMENKPGMLFETTKFIAEHNINMRALSVADSQTFGIIRLIVDDPDSVNELLIGAGYVTKLTTVLALDILDKPGMFANVLEKLSNEKINIEYAYAYTAKDGKAKMIFRVDDIEKAVKILEQENL